jgi:hypothetical protein
MTRPQVVIVTGVSVYLLGMAVACGMVVERRNDNFMLACGACGQAILHQAFKAKLGQSVGGHRPRSPGHVGGPGHATMQPLQSRRLNVLDGGEQTVRCCLSDGALAPRQRQKACRRQTA